jgi:hypothetical protein
MKIHFSETLIQNFVDHPIHEDHPQPHFAPFSKHGHLKEFDACACTRFWVPLVMESSKGPILHEGSIVLLMDHLFDAYACTLSS